MAATSQDKVLAPPLDLGTPLIERMGTRVGGHFRSVAVTILVVVGLAAGCALGGLWVFYSIKQDAVLRAQSEETMRKVTESVIRGVEAVMLQGSADAVYTYAERVKGVQGLTDLRILRVDGTEAFQDGRTITAVNTRLGSNAFQVQPRPRHAPFSLASPELERAVKQGDALTYYSHDAQGGRLMTVLHPLANSPACHGCHGPDHAVRGVLLVTTSLGPTDRAVRLIRIETLAVVAVALAAILLLAFVLVRVVVVKRARAMSDAMQRVVLGDYARRVPEHGRDEMGEMARSFNRMAESLLASSSRLNENQDILTTVLRGTREGIVIADRRGEIALANAAAERLLDKRAEEIYEGGAGKLFDDPAPVRRWDESAVDVAEEIPYRDRMLQVRACRVRGPRGGDLAVVMVIREITGEREARAGETA